MGFINMNKNDKILIIIILLFSLMILGLYKINKTANSNIAIVYYENKKVLEIDLTKDIKTYKVNGYNGPVFIKAGNGKVMVKEENSPRHLCSKQGYISKPYESIICLPNKIIVRIESNDNGIDAIVK